MVSGQWQCSVSVKDSISGWRTLEHGGCSKSSWRTVCVITRPTCCPDMSTWKTIQRERECVNTHHHSDVLRQIPGASLEEIWECSLQTCSHAHTHTHKRRSQSNRITVHYISLLKRDASSPTHTHLLSHVEVWMQNYGAEQNIKINYLKPWNPNVNISAQVAKCTSETLHCLSEMIIECC